MVCRKRRLRVPRNRLSKHSITGRRFEERRHRQSDDASVRHLLEGLAGPRAVAEEHADAEHAFATDGGDLDEGAVAHAVRHRVHAAVRKEHVVDSGAVLVQGGADGGRPQRADAKNVQ